jgi:pilus assembly protein CpaE
MTSTDITLGILTPSAEARDMHRAQVSALGLNFVEADVGPHLSSMNEREMRALTKAQPDIIIVDMDDPVSAIRTLKYLHEALPDTWLLVSSAERDPQIIIETIRAGAREYLMKPPPPGSLSQAVDRFLEEKQRAREKEGGGKVICVTAAKGGSGATSLTINLAAAIKDLGNTSVSLLDMNSPIGDAAAYLNLTPQFTISDALASASRLDSVLLESYMSDARGLAVLPGPKEFWPDLAPGVTESPGVSAMARVLEVMSQTYTHTLVDLASSLEKPRLQTLIEMASDLVVVLTPELPALWRTQRLVRFFETCGGGDKLKLVINRSRKTDDITEGEIEKTLNHPVFLKIPNNYGASIEAINSGKALVNENHSAIAASYRAMAYQLTGTTPPKKGWSVMRLFSSNGRKKGV